MRSTAEVFRLMFLRASGSFERVERQQWQPVGEVRQPIEGTADEVPVPRRSSSNSAEDDLADLICMF